MSLDKMGVIENTSIEFFKYKDKSSTLMESNDSDLCPITSYLTEEKVKHTSRLKSKKDDELNLSTPMKDVFDQIASGPNQRNTHQLNPSVAKKLDFNSNECFTENKFENDLLMETLYESILEDMICKQSEDILEEILAADSSCDVVKTPLVRATGLADTCPVAPSKPKYESILEDTICKQSEDILEEILAADSICDVVKTPLVRPTGLADTCPGAPSKPKQDSSLRTVCRSSCRKLDFDSWV